MGPIKRERMFHQAYFLAARESERAERFLVLERKRKVIKRSYVPFTGRESSRRCADCARAAVGWRFKADERGGVDKSSREPVCSGHYPVAEQAA